MKYYVYQIECKITHKIYIGYTGKTVTERFHKHYTNAMYGIKTYLYNAIRKYGIDNFTIKELWCGSGKKRAQEIETYYINHLNTFKEGYNQTLGGDGGWCVVDKDSWISKKKEATSGTRNPRYIDIDDEELLEIAYKYYVENGSIPLHHWFCYCKELGLPRSYTKFRFSQYGGGRDGFKNALKEKYNLTDSSFTYIKTEEHRNKLSEAMKKKYDTKDNQN